MYSILKTVSKVNSVASVARRATGVRTHIISGPPTRPIPKSIRGVIGGILFVGCLGVPAWITYHIPSYSKR
ncbi:unnamed protein product [Bemisia tabaci]|uniref:Uncharacterized protein n=1 Tax=Bemisia tabaci TaxID=7038 RepID=A0A9P0F0W0_BEMTA|nr:unnamed protein product [Bemisia tabaci]